MFTINPYFGLIILVAIFAAIIFGSGRRLVAGCKDLAKSSARERQIESALEKITPVCQEIEVIKRRYLALAGSAESWDRTVGFHMRKALEVITINPLLALASYRMAAECAQDCVSRVS